MLMNKLVKYFPAIFFVVILKTKDINSHKLCDGRYLNDKIRIDGKVVIITGGTSGLGFETARNLALRGGRIYLAARSEKKGTEAVETIRQSTGNMNVKFIQLDVGLLKSVGQFSERFHAVENRLDILINNAGTASFYNRTEDGLEVNMAVNHLGHFLLTNLLLDLLKVSAPSRILVVTSIGQYAGVIMRHNVNSEIYFPGIIKAYSNSKLAIVLFTQELSRRLQHTGVTVNSLDPGFARSSFAQNLQRVPVLQSFVELMMQYFGRSSEHGSQTHVMLSIDPSVTEVSGMHFVDCVQQEPAYLAKDENLALWFWNESAKLTRLSENL